MAGTVQKRILLNYIYLSRKHAGGKDQMAINLLEGIYKNGDIHQCVVLCYDYAVSYLEEIAPGVQILSIRPPKKDTEILRLLDIERVNTWVLPRLIKKNNIGVVFHASCTTGLCRLKVPSVVIPHDIKAVSHRIMGSVKIVWYKYILYKMMYAVDFKNADKIVAISKADRSEIQNYYAKYKNKIVQIYNPIKVHVSDIIPQVPRTGDIVAINLQFHHKNIITLIKAFELIADQIESNLVLVGNVPKRVHYLQEYVTAHNLSDRVIFTGFVDGKRKRELLTASCLYVNPSLFEGFGMTAVEAMILKVPTLLSRVSANYEVTKGMCRYYEPADDCEALAAAILSFFKEPEAGEQLEVKSKEMLEMYDYKKIAAQYMELFADCLDDRQDGFSAEMKNGVSDGKKGQCNHTVI